MTNQKNTAWPDWTDVVSSIESYEPAGTASVHLRRLWTPQDEAVPDLAFHSRVYCSLGLEDVDLFGDSDDLPSSSAPDVPPRAWDIGLSGEFCKNVHKIDRKLQGRILDAITEISDDPLAARGDTVKPLTGKMKGLWRFRIGDYRLIYNPDASRRRIALVAFASRGSIYGD